MLSKRMERTRKPVWAMILLYALVFMISLSGPISASVDHSEHCGGSQTLASVVVVNDQSHSHDVSATDTRDEEARAPFEAPSTCMPHICSAVETRAFRSPVLLGPIVASVFIEPDETVLLETVYGLHRPPNT